MSLSCVTCHHDIDESVKICPYCGSDPRTGEKIVDTQAMLRKMFQPKAKRSTVLDFARQRQGVVVAGAVVIGFLILAALYQFATARNATAVAAGSGVPITEVTDVTDQGDETRQLPMPPLQFQYDGHSQTMRTFIVEPGATPPAPAQPAAAPQQPAAPAPQPPTKH